MSKKSTEFRVQISDSEVILSLKNINKTYHQGQTDLHVLKDISFDVSKGEIVALVGPSGCGKSTLLQIAGLLDKAQSGEIILSGENCSKLSDKKRTLMRRNKIGFVYQFHHLLPDFNALENVAIPQIIAKTPKKKAREEAKKLLAELGLSERIKHRPSQLSGGEQQRVAIARALANKPLVLLADEPTGNLDPENSKMVFDTLVTKAKESGIAMLIATHNMELAQRAQKIIRLK